MFRCKLSDMFTVSHFFNLLRCNLNGLFAPAQLNIYPQVFCPLMEIILSVVSICEKDPLPLKWESVRYSEPRFHLAPRTKSLTFGNLLHFNIIKRVSINYEGNYSRCNFFNFDFLSFPAGDFAQQPHLFRSKSGKKAQCISLCIVFLTFICWAYSAYRVFIRIVVVFGFTPVRLA